MIDIDTISLLCSLDRQNASTTKKKLTFKNHYYLCSVYSILTFYFLIIIKLNEKYYLITTCFYKVYSVLLLYVPI